MWDPWWWIANIAAPSEAESGDIFEDMRGAEMQEGQGEERSVDGRLVQVHEEGTEDTRPAELVPRVTNKGTCLQSRHNTLLILRPTVLAVVEGCGDAVSDLNRHTLWIDRATRIRLKVRVSVPIWRELHAELVGHAELSSFMRSVERADLST